MCLATINICVNKYENMHTYMYVHFIFIYTFRYECECMYLVYIEDKNFYITCTAYI